MILAKKKKKRHKYRPKKESTEPRNKSTHLLTTDLLTKVPRKTSRKRIVFSTNCAETVGYAQAKK